MKRFDVINGGHFAANREYCEDGEFVDAADAMILVEALCSAQDALLNGDAESRKAEAESITELLTELGETK